VTTTDEASEHRRYRRAEPAFARAVGRALGDARSVLQVATDARTPRYAPDDRAVTTIGSPDAPLPFTDDAFDAAVSAFSLPDRDDLESGITELRRVTRGPVVLLVSDPERLAHSWLAEYAPEVVAAEARRHPPLDRVVAALGGASVACTPVPIPFTCVDGFSEAYYARPERLLDAGARRADPAWGLVDELTARRSVAALRTAIESGDWDRRHGALRVRPSHEGSVVLVVAEPTA
jgi:SAM-dependent methyltransferase